MNEISSWIYILTNFTNKVLYTGITSDLIKRIYEHKEKLVPGFTSKYNCNKLVYYEQFSSITYAIEREKQIKKYKRSKKIDLIAQFNPDWKDLYPDIC